MRGTECNVLILTKISPPIKLQVARTERRLAWRIVDIAKQTFSGIDRQTACAQLDFIARIDAQIGSKINATDPVVAIRTCQTIIAAAVHRQTVTGIPPAPADARLGIANPVFPSI